MNIEMLKAATPGSAREKEPVVYVSNAGYFAAFFGRRYVDILAYLNTQKFYKKMAYDMGYSLKAFNKDVQLRINICIGENELIGIFLVRNSQKTDGQLIIELVFENTAA